MGNLTIWLTPVWVLSAGVTAGMAILAIACGLLWLVSRRTAESVDPTRQRKHPAVDLVRRDRVRRVLFPGDAGHAREVDLAFARTACQTSARTKRASRSRRAPTTRKCPSTLSPTSCKATSLASDQDLVIGVEKGKAYSSPLIRVEGGDDYIWTPSAKRQRLFNGPVTKIYVTNKSDAETTLKIETRTDVPLARGAKDSRSPRRRWSASTSSIC